MLTKWNNDCRYSYNKTVWLASETKEFNSYYLRNLVVPKEVNQHISWILETPKEIRAGAVFDAVSNIKSCFRNLKNKNIKHFTMPFKRKRSETWTICIPKSALKIINPRTLSIYPKISNSHFKTTEDISEIQNDCKIHFNGLYYYLLVPYTKQKKETQNRMCGIDPGVRTFMSVYDPENGCLEIGAGADKKINVLNLRIDYLISAKSKLKTKKLKDTINTKILKIRDRIKNLQSELHHKTSNFLCGQYKNIYLPKLESGKMSIKNKRKLNNNTTRRMLSLSHALFFDMMKTKSIEYGSTIIVSREEYTSQMCCVCSAMKKIGGSKTYNCESCGSILDRDLNSSKNIFIKNFNCELQPS
jgi:putative transposase